MRAAPSAGPYRARGWWGGRAQDRSHASGRWHEASRYFRSILTASPQWSVTVVAPADCEM